MKKTIIFIVLILLLIAACAYYNCMQKEKFEQEKNEAVAAAVQHTLDSINQYKALEAPKEVVQAHKPEPPPPPPPVKKKEVKTKPEVKPDVLLDERDGQEYAIFEDGNENWWMAQNLNFATPGSWCYDLDDAKCAEWGRLYTWDEANSACPEGWHLPNDQEWSALISYYGGIHHAGGNLKPGGASKFNAQFSGYRDKEGFFGKINESAYYWSSTDQNADYASFKGLYHNVDNVGTYTYTKPDGMSVRCVKDKQ